MKPLEYYHYTETVVQFRYYQKYLGGRNNEKMLVTRSDGVGL